MLRAALKPWFYKGRKSPRHIPTHTMLRAALKRESSRGFTAEAVCPDTHNAACGIETDERRW